MAVPGEPLFHLNMCSYSARRLRRKIGACKTACRKLASASPIGVTRIYGEPLVGDLPERAFAEVGLLGRKLAVAHEVERLGEELHELRCSL